MEKFLLSINLKMAGEQSIDVGEVKSIMQT